MKQLHVQQFAHKLRMSAIMCNTKYFASLGEHIFCAFRANKTECQ